MNWLFILILMVNLQKEFVPDNLVWKNRILIYSGEGDFSPWLSENKSKELVERKLLFFQFRGSVLVDSNFKESIRADEFLEKLNLEKTIKEKWVLIGLDGGIKNSGYSIPSPPEIFRIIDAMPMRQSEIRK